MKTKKKQWNSLIWFLLGVISACSFSWVHDYRNPTPVSALPSEASNIEGNFWYEGFLPDYTYQLKAQISKRGFEEYVSRLGYNINGSNSYSIEDGDYTETVIYHGEFLQYEASSK